MLSRFVDAAQSGAGRLLEGIAAELAAENGKLAGLEARCSQALSAIDRLGDRLAADFAATWRGYTSSRRDAIALTSIGLLLFSVLRQTGLCCEFYALIFGEPQHDIDAVFLFGLLTAAGALVFSVRRWRELSREVAVRIEAERRARALAQQDALTELSNRRGLSVELERAISRARREGLSVSLLMLDLDRFKPVNDMHGHLIGDALLIAVAGRLRVVTRTEEFLARLGGDEFAVVITHPAGRREIPDQVARRLSREVSAPYEIGDSEIHIGASIGIASFPEDADDIESLVRRADVALYRAKENARGEHHFFEEAMDLQVRERSEIEASLHLAIRRGEIVPFYQPLVCLKSRTLIGFEALARWHRPERGDISPGLFIPIAEDNGQIGELSMAILRQACRDALAWSGELTVSVNISPLQFRDRWLAEKILNVLVETGFPPRRLEIEVTENAVVKDVEAARRILVSLKNQGVQIALDDFGAGYSSLQHLSTLPFDRIKIDRSFVEMLKTSDDAEKIINAIVSLGDSLGMPTTGEGIEDEESAERLIAAGCAVGQGWLFGRPVPAAEVAALVERFAERPAMRRIA
ncbi:MAG: EAL domain-containing protein [Hyphomicrobiaceae bacterium]